METCVVLHVRAYDFKDDDGQSVKGATVAYLTGDRETGTDRLGYPVLSISAQPEILSQFQAVPGLYDLDFKQRPGKNGRPTITLVGCKFKQAVNLHASPEVKPA